MDLRPRQARMDSDPISARSWPGDTLSGESVEPDWETAIPHHELSRNEKPAMCSQDYSTLHSTRKYITAIAMASHDNTSQT